MSALTRRFPPLAKLHARLQRSWLYGRALRLRHGGADGLERASQSNRNAERIEILKSFIPAGGIGAELGVHKGFFSPVLLKQLAPTKLYLIDPWYLQGTHWTWGEGNRRTVDALCAILQAMEQDLASGRVELRIEDDVAALNRMPDAHLDWVYLDSTHAYEHTVNELRTLQRKVKSGGIIAGDDWRSDPKHRHHGVCKAVREFVDRAQGELVHVDEATAQWILRLT